MSATTTSKPTIKSYLGDKAEVTANGGNVTFLANTVSTAIVDAIGFGVSVGFKAGITKTKADLEPTVSAFTVGGGLLSGNSVSLVSRVNTDASGNPISPTYTYNTILGDNLPTVVAPSFARVSLGALALGAGVAGGLATAVNSPVVTTRVGSGTNVTATSLEVRSRVFGDAQVDALSISAGLGAGIGIISADVTTGGSVTTEFNGTSGTIGTATVASNVIANPHTEGRGFSGALGVAVNVGSISIDVKTSTTTGVGGSLTASGLVTVLSDVRVSVSAFYKALQIAALAAIGTATVTGTDETNTRTYVSGSATSTTGQLNVLAYHNFDGSNFITANTVEASASMTSASLLLAIGSASMTATAKAVTKAEVDSSGTLAAPSGTVSLKALSGDYAESHFSRTQGALISVAPNADPTAIASGDTEANLNGNVKQGSASGASAIVVLAKANDTANAGMDNAGGGLLSIADSHSSSQGSPKVVATLGGASSVIIATNDINAQALSLNDSDASTHSTTGGALNLNFFGATSWINPTVNMVVTGGAQVTSNLGTITVDATSNKAPVPTSDGTFNAGGISGNTITFTLIHNAVTGQLVVYDNKGNPSIAPNLQGRTMSLIVTSPTQVQLGVVFDGGIIDPATDIIDFGNRAHHFITGDIVVYQPIGGGIGNLPPGTYKVFVIDPYRIKLQDVGVSFAEVNVNGASGVDSGTHKINGSAFSNGDFVPLPRSAASRHVHEPPRRCPAEQLWRR